MKVLLNKMIKDTTEAQQRLTDEQRKAIDKHKYNENNQIFVFLLKFIGFFEQCIKIFKMSWFISVSMWVTTEVLMKKVWIMDVDNLSKGLIGASLILGYFLFFMDNFKRI